MTQKYSILQNYLPFLKESIGKYQIERDLTRIESDTHQKNILPYNAGFDRESEFIQMLHNEGFIRPNYREVLEQYETVNERNLTEKINELPLDALEAVLANIVRSSRFVEGLLTGMIDSGAIYCLSKKIVELGQKNET